MRITHNMMSNTTLRNLNVNTEKLDKLQDQLTSGRRIASPADDPIGAAAAVGFKRTLDEIDQYVKNIDSANSWLEATDSALQSLGDLLQRARELAVQGANDTLNISDRQKIAVEIGNLLDQAILVGKSTYAGQYIFAGYKVNTEPFTPVGNPPASVVYNGDTNPIARQIDGGANSVVIVNITGDQLSSIFATLIQLRDDLTAGNGPAIAARIADLDLALDNVLTLRSQVGARMNRLTTQRDRLEGLKVNISDLLSKTQDVDMAEAISAFALQQNVYHAALAAGARAIQPSLLDYLR